MKKEKLAIILPLIATVMAWPFRLPVPLKPAFEMSLSGASSALSEAQHQKIQHARRDSDKDTRHGYILSKLIHIRADTDTTTTATTATTEATTATSTSDTATTTADTTATSTTTSETSSTTSSTATSTTATTTSATTSSTSTTTSSTTTASTSSSSSSSTTSTASKTSSTTSSSASCAATATSSACVALRKFNHDGEMRAVAVFSVLAGLVLAFILWRYIKKRREQGRQQANRMSQASAKSAGSAGSAGSTELLTGEVKTLSPEEKQRYRESLMFMDERASNPRSASVSAVGSRRNSRNLTSISPLARGESSDSANTDIALEPLRPAHT
ncbi:hypothetical protein Plec18170_001469 [Paecilomyces lecythidis]